MKDSGNVIALKRIKALLSAIQTDPYHGIGKPEALKYSLSGKWSRRITKEDRIIYEVFPKYIQVYSLKGHY